MVIAVAAAGLAVSAGIGAYGASQSAGAASDAAHAQVTAAQQAAQAQLQMYNQTRQDLGPYRQAGYGALGGLQGLAGSPYPTFDSSQYPTLDPSQYDFNTGQYAFDPSKYAFNPPSGQDVLQQDPGYQFRLSEGQKALDRSAASRGLLLSGGQIKATTQYNQGMASQEYAAAYNRALTQNQLNYGRALTGNELAYNRALTGNQMAYSRGLTQNQMQYGRGLTDYELQAQARQAQYGELAGIAGMGQGATNVGVQAGLQTGQGVAGALYGQGAATAAGIIGQNNAWNQFYGQLGNQANSFYGNYLTGQQMGYGNTGYIPYTYGTGDFSGSYGSTGLNGNLYSNVIS